MKAYILTVTLSALLSAMASAMTPKGWEKYIQLVTGIVILFCIMTPLLGLVRTGFDFSVPELRVGTEKPEDIHKELIMDDLRARIEADIEERLRKEFNCDVEAEVEIEVNDEGEIECVKSVTVTGDKIGDMAKERLIEIYGVNEIYESQ